MKPEAATVLANGRRFSYAKRSFLSRMGDLGRALKFQPAPPQSATIQHPLERLTFFNGTIHEMHQGQPGREYMYLSGLEVARKLTLREIDAERCEYRFELNLPSDPIWRYFFRQALPNVAVGLDGRILVLVCVPADLESSYHRNKTAILRANSLYAAERERLIGLVVAQDEQRQAANELAENRKAGLRRQFDCLEV